MNTSQDIRLKLLQQNASHMERLHLRKSNEMSGKKDAADSCCGEAQRFKCESEPAVTDQTRLGTTGGILGVVAHKWRQPLNAIALIIQNMVDAWKCGEMNDEIMERSEHKALEQITLLNRIIDDSRGFFASETTTEHFDPVESVKTVVAQLAEWFSASSVINFRISNGSEDSLQAVGCQHSFERVIVNLICNANDAIEERQRSSDSKSKGIITVCLCCSEEDITISIEDTGTGIDEASMGHLFKPYFTTKKKANGLGMGLYLSRLVVENSMNGNLWFESIPGGARFSIWLPALPVERLCV